MAISVTVTDGEYTDSDVFTIVVLPVNDAPEMDLPEVVIFSEDGDITEDFSDYIVDIDEDELSLSVTGHENVEVSIDGFTVTFSSAQDWNGTEILTFMVDDSQGRAVATDDVEVTVMPVNDAPILTDIDNQQMNEDSQLTITLVADDIDGDVLSYGAVSSFPSDVSVCLLYTSDAADE